MLQLLFCILASSEESFMVSVPHNNLIAISGHPAVLGCHFTPYTDLTDLTIKWHREEDSQVVHWFLNKQDQLDHQSPAYHNRTSLYISELSKGNASLRIEGVGLKDVGWYICNVRNNKGVGNGKIKLDYAAFYSEPKLSIHANSTTVTVQFETEGFPEPEVIWLDKNNQRLHHHLEVHDQKENGIYLVKSTYKAHKTTVDVMFSLKNHLLNQKIQRPVNFSYVPENAGDGYTSAIIILAMVCIILGSTIMGILLPEAFGGISLNQ